MSQPVNEMPASRLPLFLILHVLLLSGGAGWATVRYRSMEEAKIPPVPRLEPVAIRPLYDDPEAVSDDELQRILVKLQPRLRGPSPKINHVDHALRMWGVPAAFDDEDCLSGVEMRELLLDHRRYSDHWGEASPSLLVPTDDGVSVSVALGPQTSSHVDHTLATMAEIGTPLDYPVITSEGEVALHDLFQTTLKSFSLNQTEYEWSTLVFAIYMPHKAGWYSKGGQHITFDLLADRIMRQRLTQGVCRGNHRTFTLAMLLRIDDQISILSDESRAEVEAWLTDVTNRLVQSQSSEGFWDDQWSGPEIEGTPPPPGANFTTAGMRLNVTGHVLEWWAMAPQEVLPPEDVRRRATRWLIEEVDELSPAEVRQYYTYLTHAGRALAMWRGRFPHECQ